MFSDTKGEENSKNDKKENVKEAFPQQDINSVTTAQPFERESNFPPVSSRPKQHEA